MILRIVGDARIRPLGGERPDMTVEGRSGPAAGASAGGLRGRGAQERDDPDGAQDEERYRGKCDLSHVIQVK